MSNEMVNTVTGPIKVNDLGVTLMHEHLLIGLPGWEAHASIFSMSREEMLDVCVEKVESMQAFGVQSMLDPCPNDLGRDVTLAAEVSERTGFNIICATGLYKENQGGAPYWEYMRKIGRGPEFMAELFVRELTEGIGETGIKAGIIKAGTGVGEVTDYERDVFTAAAMAAVETGAPITTHTDEGTMGEEQQKILMDHGVAPHKIIIGHSCGSADHQYHKNILEKGSYLGFDRFGLEVETSDEQRVSSLSALLKINKERQIVVSHDSAWCMLGQPLPPELVVHFTPNPENLFDPTHFHRNIIPKLLEAGATEQQIETMLIENPRRYFSGEAPD